MKSFLFSVSLLPLLTLVATLHAQVNTTGDQSSTTTTASTSAAPSPERVVVTGSPLDRSAFDTAQSVSTLADRELKTKAASTLGETLDGEPGISGSGFTAGASRPIIRGQQENRVRVLNNGTEVFDVSNLSPDHAPSVSPLLSQAVEVVRGPATILYGSSAIGGVVNVLDNRIPSAAPANGRFAGELVGRMGYVDFERSGAASLDFALTPHLVFHLDGSRFYTDNVMVPGFALSPRLRAALAPEQSARGDRFGGDPVHYVPNTYVRTKDFGVGASYIWGSGYVGVSFGQFLSVYGVPDDPEADDPAESPAPVRLDVTKRQWALRASFADPLPHVAAANLKVSYTDYEHLEIDGNEVGSTFKTNGVDSRLEVVHKPVGAVEGSLGAQVLYKRLAVLGSEAFLQPTDTISPAGFVFEEVRVLGGDDKESQTTAPASAATTKPAWKPSLRVQTGGRVEYNRVSIHSSDPALTSLLPGDRTTREFLPLSASAGLVYEFLENTALALTLAYSERAPTAEELYARGPHDATFQYLVGDPNLGKEKQLGLDVSIRRRAGRVTGSLSGFYNRFYDFIDFTPTAEVIDGLRVFNYTPKNADFYGGEALVDIHLLPASISRPVPPAGRTSAKAVVSKEAARETVANPNDLFLELRADYVHAEDRDSGEPLPRITPLRLGVGLGFSNEQWNLKVEGVRVNHQFRTAAFETSTPGYTFLNASVSYSFQLRETHWDVFVRGVNLTNEEARNHQSFLKDVLPLPGRNVVGGVRVSF